MGTNAEVFDKMEDLGAEPREVVMRLGDNEAMYVGFLKEFAKGKEMETLRLSVKEQDGKNAYEASHTLKGLALNLGLLSFADHCIDMVTLYREGKDREGDAILPEMERSFREMTDLIARLS